MAQAAARWDSGEQALSDHLSLANKPFENQPEHSIWRVLVRKTKYYATIRGKPREISRILFACNQYSGQCKLTVPLA